jgi:hypothetical protein
MDPGQHAGFRDRIDERGEGRQAAGQPGVNFQVCAKEGVT